MSNNKTYLDEKGYENLLNEIARLEGELVEALKGRTGLKSYEYTTTLADAENRRAVIVSQLNGLYQMRDNCEIIKQEDMPTETFLIGDIAEISLNMNGLSRTMTVMLVNDNRNKVDGVSNITLNSPIGRAIYGLPVGAKGTYKANGNTCGFEIIKITKKERESGLHQ